MRLISIFTPLLAIAIVSGAIGFEIGKHSAAPIHIVSGTLVMPPLSFLHEACPASHICSMGQRYAEIPEENNTHYLSLQATPEDAGPPPDKSEKP
jgi:hypothetical protein